MAFRLVLKAYQQHVDNVQTLNRTLEEKLQALSDQDDALRMSERRVMQILKASPLPIIVAEFETGVRPGDQPRLGASLPALAR